MSHIDIKKTFFFPSKLYKINKIIITSYFYIYCTLVEKGSEKKSVLVIVIPFWDNYCLSM